MSSEIYTEKIPFELEDGSQIYIEAAISGSEDVSKGIKSFENISKSIESIITTISKPINKVNPDKATVSFGLEIGIQGGSLMAALVRGTGKSNLQITLEWEKPKQN